MAPPSTRSLLVLALLVFAMSTGAAARGAHGGGGHHTRRGHGGAGRGGHHTRAGHAGGRHGDGLLAKSISELIPDVVVDKRGGGANVTTIGEALSLYRAGTRGGAARPFFLIYIAGGIYEEHLVINDANVILIGDGMSSTVITGNRSRNTGHDTEQSATFTVRGDGFMARDIGIHNTAGGPEDKQAVALSLAGKEMVLYRCSIRGFQDTLWANVNRQFYRECQIWGTTDFIFGDAAAVFQRCAIFARPPPTKGQPNVVTAQGRQNHAKSGFIFQNCTVMASTLPGENLTGVQTYLGRPWRHHAQTVFLMSDIEQIIHADGWVHWNSTKEAGGDDPMPDHRNHTFYGEYRNHLLGGSANQILHWDGFYTIKNDTEAEQFTAGRFINGGAWLPRTGVPYDLGLYSSAQ